jgi:3-hydroxybutyryl-CoA dehydrogenase
VVGVVGAGTMGAGIAQVCLQAGHEVLLHDVDETAVARGRKRIEDGLDRLAAKDRLAAEDRDSAVARLRDATALVELAGEADIVIEAALEQLDLKRTLFRALEEGARDDAILATNTSALSVTAIAEECREPGRVVGLHFFNPAPLMPLVEVVHADTTAVDVAARAAAFVEGLGKTPIGCRDAPGFIVNRVNRPFTLEALRMLEAGEAGVEEIDAAVRAGGYPMGPFELMDLVGIDVNFAVARALYDAFEEAVRFRPSPIQERLVGAGRLGRKTGGGFYRYDESGRAAGVDPDVQASGPGRLGAEQILQRIELPIVNEAYHAVGEGVATPPDIDRALRLGASHPRGPFERAGELGLGVVVKGLAALESVHGERFAVAPALWRVASV